MSAKQIHPPITGTTEDTLEECSNVDARPFSDSQFIISNTGTSHSLHYDVYVYNNYTVGRPYNVFSNDITPQDSDEVILCRHAKVIIEINAATAGNQTTYQIDGIAGR